MADRQLYLGTVARIQPARQRSGYALLRPLYKSSADLTEWLPVEDAEDDFPNRGFVTWYSAHPEITVGSVWQFRTEESFTYEKDNPERDQYFTAKSPAPVPPHEVIDWRRGDQPYDAELVRRDVAHEGIWLPYTPSPVAYLWLDDHKIIGPIHLIQDEGRWRVSADQSQQRLVSEFSIPDGMIAELRVAGAKRFFLTPGAQTGAPVRSLDWSPDDIVLKRVLHWLKKVDPGYAATAKFTKEAVNRAAHLVRSNAAADGEAAPLTQQLERALVLASTLEENSGLAQAIIEELLNLPSVLTIISEAADAERRTARDQIRAELASEASQVESLRSEKASLEEEIRRLENQRAETAAAVSRQIEESRAALEAAMSEQLSDVMSRPAHALANIAILRAALGLDDSPNSSARTLVSSPRAEDAAGQTTLARMWFAPGDTQIEALSGQDEFRRSLDATFESKQFDLGVGRRLHAAFLSGVMPVLAGDEPYEVVEAYASCAAGGRLLWIPVPTSVFEPTDLLGKFSAEAGQFIPHPCGLLDLLLHARSSNELYVVVLDGINRAPIDAYLNPLLSLYSDSRLEEHRRRTLHLLPAGAIEPNSPYSAAAQLSWSPNVLLTGIWSEGAVGLPTPPRFWDAAALISVGQFQEESKTSIQSTFDHANYSTVSLAKWSEWQAANNEQAAGSAQVLEKALKLLASKGIALSRRRVAVCAEFYAAMSQWLQTDAEVLRETALCCLAPRLLAAGSDYSLLVEVIEKASGAAGDLEVRLQKAQMLLS